MAFRLLSDVPHSVEQHAPMLEAVQRGIERALLDGERAAGDVLDAQQHAVAMLGTERQGLEDQQIERAGQQLSLGNGAWLGALLYELGE